MDEWTVVVFIREGEMYGFGALGSPSRKQIVGSYQHFSFVRGNVRIHVLSVTQSVTVNIAREFAIALYEGRTRTINFDDAARSTGFASVFSARGAS